MSSWDHVDVCDLEVLTVTSTSAVITWMTRSRWLGPIPRPMATDTQLWCGPADGAMTLPVVLEGVIEPPED